MAGMFATHTLPWSIAALGQAGQAQRRRLAALSFTPFHLWSAEVKSRYIGSVSPSRPTQGLIFARSSENAFPMTRKAFDPAKYGELWSEWLQRAPQHALDAPAPNPETSKALLALNVRELFGKQKITHAEMARCCLSGLLLAHDLLDASHTISQEIESGEGSYWHGVMHRREGDYSNAKYWFRRVGLHPIHGELAAESAALRNQLSPASTWPDSPALVRRRLRRSLPSGGGARPRGRVVPGGRRSRVALCYSTIALKPR